MATCKSCKGIVQDDAVQQSIDELERVLRGREVKPQLIKRMASQSGPLCPKCFKRWAR
jgi:hypothetical protein